MNSVQLIGHLDATPEVKMDMTRRAIKDELGEDHWSLQRHLPQFARSLECGVACDRSEWHEEMSEPE